MPNFEITDNPASGDTAFLEAEMAKDVIAKGARAYDRKPYGVFMRDKGRKIVAGLTGAIFWDLLYIDNIWVDEKQRGQKLGTALVQAAEEKGKQRGCLSAYLWTQSFEAPEFYRKLGYQQFVVMEDVPLGHQRIGFMKRLAA